MSAGGRARSPYVMAVTFRPGVDTAQGVARLDRRRRRDLAILKMLGFTHADVGRAVAWANLISIGPAVSAMRIRPASVLRQE
jgi:hypothetical protein